MDGVVRLFEMFGEGRGTGCQGVMLYAVLLFFRLFLWVFTFFFIAEGLVIFQILPFGIFWFALCFGLGRQHEGMNLFYI